MFLKTGGELLAGEASGQPALAGVCHSLSCAAGLSWVVVLLGLSLLFFLFFKFKTRIVVSSNLRR